MSLSVPFPWKTNVMGMLGECRYLLLSIMCPGLAYYAISETFEANPAGVVESCIGGYCICCGFLLRTRLRRKYNLDGSVLGDFLAHCCCHCVAMARIWREAEAQANAEKEMTTVSPTPQQHQQQAQQYQPYPGAIQPVQQGQQQSPYMMTVEPPIQQFIPPGVQQYAYTDPHFQQPVYVPQTAMMAQQQQGIPVPGQGLHQQNTIDTNLSDFDSRNEQSAMREETSSYKRIDSMDPPPSNTDPDPWDMLRRRESSMRRRQEIPPPLVQSTTIQTQPRRPELKKRPSQRLTEHTGVPYYETIKKEGITEEDGNLIAPSPFAARRDRMPESSGVHGDINERLASLRPPNLTRPPPVSEGSESKQTNDTSAIADQIILGGSNLTKLLNITKHDVEQLDRPQVQDPVKSTLDKAVTTLSRAESTALLATKLPRNSVICLQMFQFLLRSQQWEVMSEYRVRLRQALSNGIPSKS